MTPEQTIKDMLEKGIDHFYGNPRGKEMVYVHDVISLIPDIVKVVEEDVIERVGYD